MENFRAKIQEIQLEASRLYSLKLSEEMLFEELNKIPQFKLSALAIRYADSQGRPVNALRLAIINLRLKGVAVTKFLVDQMIERGNDLADKNSFKAWGYFSILFPIISNDLSFNVKHELYDFGKEIIKSLNIDYVAASPFVVDFNGPRNFGSDNVWMAIYNKSNSNQTTAIQLFIQIDYRGLICHLYDRLKDHFISSIKIEDSHDMSKRVISFFDKVKDKLIEDTNDPELERYRELGVKSNVIFKISHGAKYFPTLKEIQYCIDQNIVVVHRDTGPKGRGDTSQYKNFVAAKRGDLFYLCWGNKRFLLIGQFIDEIIEDYNYIDEEGWKMRKYRFICEAVTSTSFSGSSKWWTPNNSSTCIPIPQKEIKLANDLVFNKYFKVELKTDFNTELLPPKVGAAARQTISIDEIIEPKLEVHTIARELTGIVDNLKKNKGQMIGIFGSWGRGKTFLYNYMKDWIESKNDLNHKYIHHTFNAWKYQETETIWAHLYGAILEGYLGQGNRFERFRKTWTLNINRKGVWPIVSLIGSLLVTITLTFFVSASVKIHLLQAAIGIFGGFIGIVQAIRIYRKYYQPLKETIESYSTIHNYNEILGIQDEIQKELVTLVSTWLKDKDRKKARLLLFVDDIDRCREEKIIQVLDALRVMLDADDLIERIVVLVAIDEVLLERAIKHKYREFKFDETDQYSKNLVEEYMDKLFIAGIKLPKLNEEEQAVILRNYAINNEILERIVQDETLEEFEEEEREIQDTSLETIVFPDNNPREFVDYESEYFLLERELEYLSSNSNNLSANVTPRQLRIYMYRYLLAKNIASDILWTRTGVSQLTDEYCEFLAKSIALRSNQSQTFIFTNEVSLNLINDPTLRAITPKLIEMVVPY